MDKSKILNKLFNQCPEFKFDNNSKIVFISDCHRGDGSFKDSLLPNCNIYLTALRYYYYNNFTYIEIGDGDELWKFTNINDIYYAYEDVYNLLYRYKEADRLYMIYGNHDYEKRKKSFLNKIIRANNEKSILYKFYKDLPIYEALRLTYSLNQRSLFVIHGHQVDFFNYQLAPLTKFLVRYFWGVVEEIGLKDPTSPAKSNSKRTKIDLIIENWVKENNQITIAGHTHRTRFPAGSEPPYFNDGCCVQPSSISSIEIEKGNISLVKWSIKALTKGQLVVKRHIIGGPESLMKY